MSKLIPIEEVPAGLHLHAIIAQALKLHESMGFWMNDNDEIVYAACVGCDGIPTWNPSGNIKDAYELEGHIEKDESPLDRCRAFLKAHDIDEVEIPD